MNVHLLYLICLLQDVNECAEGLDGCIGEGATCVNEVPGYTCICLDGYVLVESENGLDICEGECLKCT